MGSNSRPPDKQLRAQVHRALDAWPDPEARRKLVDLASAKDLWRLRDVGWALARCGTGRRDASEEFLERYEDDRRIGLRTSVLYARLFAHEGEPRAQLTEMRRAASYPGRVPWPAVMDGLNHMWAVSPREMFRLMPGWLTHRDPMRRWASLHGLEIPARRDPRSALKVLRLLRGEKHPRVRRLLGHVLGQGLYVRHPEVSLEEMARWLGDGVRAAPAITRQAERQVELWFDSGQGSERQRLRLLRAARKREEHRSPRVRSHARRLVRLLDE